MSKNHLEDHYQQVGKRYDRLYQVLFGKNREKIAYQIAEKMNANDGAKVVADIGGGTGTMIEFLKEITDPQNTFILVEPFESMFEKAKQRKSPPDRLVKSTAEDFVSESERFNTLDLMICQEMIHHVTALKNFFEGAFQVLKNEGMILIITRPTEVEFPFGKHGKRTWKESYAVPPNKMGGMLAQAGFQVIEETYLYPISIDKVTWMEIVGTDSLFSMYASMSAQERQEDLAEVKTKDDELKFNDKILFIIGVKK